MSVRADLMSLSEADLADIATRGALNRAKRELDGGKVSGTLTEERGTVSVAWSDGPTSTIYRDRTLVDAVCDCAAPGVCRHLLRLVLLYQAEHATRHERVVEPWCPGTITDARLAEQLPARQLTAARALWDAGVVAEVTRSTKPVARFHRLRHTVRFLVPHDVRYVRCDCTEDAPCVHAALAVWAFRRLDPEERSKIVDTAPSASPPDALLDAAEAAVGALAKDGLANVPSSVVDRLDALQQQLRQAGVVWPAEVLADVRRSYEHYHQHDSRFAPERLAQLFGEFAVRLDALRAPSLPIPRLFVQGQHDDQAAMLGQTRMIGLGCTVRSHRNAVEMIALLQDDSTGLVAAVSRHFATEQRDDEDDRGDDDFPALSRRLVVRGRDLATIGAGQLILKTGTLHSEHRLSFGRSDTTAYPQRYRWEELQAPVLAESFEEIHARLANLPPASLRPRRHGEDVHVVPIERVEDVRFARREHALRATLFSGGDSSAQLLHPYDSRNRHGLQRALEWLSIRPEQLRFVAGNFRLSGRTLVVAPTGLVFEQGDARVLIQPWIDDMDATLEHATLPQVTAQPVVSPLGALIVGLAETIGEHLVTGTSGVQRDTRWRSLRHAASDVGLDTVVHALDRLADADTPDATHDTVLCLAVLCTLAGEL